MPSVSHEKGCPAFRLLHLKETRLSLLRLPTSILPTPLPLIPSRRRPAPHLAPFPAPFLAPNFLSLHPPSHLPFNTLPLLSRPRLPSVISTRSSPLVVTPLPPASHETSQPSRQGSNSFPTLLSSIPSPTLRVPQGTKMKSAPPASPLVAPSQKQASVASNLE